VSAVDREARLLDALAVLADTLVADYDVIDLLQTLVDTCSALLDIEAAGLLLADPESGDLDLVASTSESTRIVEAMQLSVVAGPCIDAYRDSRIVSVPDIAALPDEFGAFRASALDEGFRSVYAIPMRLRSSTIGAVNLFRTETGELNDADRRAAQALTDVATIGILHERTARASDVLQRQLQQALDSRVVIEQAKGVLAHTHGITPDDAFVRLRAFARSERRSIAEVARGLVDRTMIF
jgi:transcriptional regulator with GAF, ATPase, and Fis domain